MNILNITYEQSRVPHPEFLDYITLPEQRAGVNQERYWMIDTQIFDKFVNPDLEAQKFAHLLYSAFIKDFQLLMISKCLNSMKSEEKSEMNS